MPDRSRHTAVVTPTDARPGRRSAQCSVLALTLALGVALGVSGCDAHQDVDGDWSAEGTTLHYSAGLAPGDLSFAQLDPGGGCICGAAIAQASGLRVLATENLRYRGDSNSGLSVAVIDASADGTIKGESSDEIPDSTLVALSAQLGVPPTAPVGSTYRFERTTVGGLPAAKVAIGHAVEPDGTVVNQVHWVVFALAAERIYKLECQSLPTQTATVETACESVVATLVVH